MNNFKSLFLVTIHIFVSLALNGQANNAKIKSESKMNTIYPKQILSGNKTGVYKQVLNADQTTVSKGDYINIEHFISGYGLVDIKTAKIFYSTSADIIAIPGSFITHSFKSTYYDDVDETHIGWGGKTEPITRSSAILVLSGTTDLEGRLATLTSFDDSHKLRPPVIMTEIFTGRYIENEQAPIHWKIKIKDDLKAGNYYITFVFTYFNGESWQSDKVELPIKVMAWYEKQESLIQKAAWFIFFITFISFILSIISFIDNKKGLKDKSSKEAEISNTISKLNQTIKDLNKTNKNLINKVNFANKKDSINIKQEIKKKKSK